MKKMIHLAVQECIFPEVWYVLDGWLSLCKSSEVVEVGAGHGLFSLAMVKSGRTLTCTDPSPTGLETVRQRFRQQNLEATFVQARFSKLPFADESCDTVVSLNSIDFVRAPDKYICELHRILRPGGTLCASATAPLGPWSIPYVARCLRYDEKRRPYQPLSLLKLINYINLAGFAVRSVKPFGNYLPWPAAKAFKLPIPGGHLVMAQKQPLR